MVEHTPLYSVPTYREKYTIIRRGTPYYNSRIEIPITSPLKRRIKMLGLDLC